MRESLSRARHLPSEGARGRGLIYGREGNTKRPSVAGTSALKRRGGEDIGGDARDLRARRPPPVQSRRSPRLRRGADPQGRCGDLVPTRGCRARVASRLVWAARDGPQNPRRVVERPASPHEAGGLRGAGDAERPRNHRPLSWSSCPLAAGSGAIVLGLRRDTSTRSPFRWAPGDRAHNLVSPQISTPTKPRGAGPLGRGPSQSATPVLAAAEELVGGRHHRGREPAGTCPLIYVTAPSRRSPRYRAD